jgi:hypothetical protein
MSNLAPLPINTSYKGLLNLENSTTGITSTFQSIQDGLGNDTGLNISTKGLSGKNFLGIYQPEIPKYLGQGITTTIINPAGIINSLIVTPFYDSGQFSYSAVTVHLQTPGPSDVFDISFYNAQSLPTYGYSPYQQIIAPLNISTTATGLVTTTTPSPFSFSGQGPGIYFMVTRYTSVSGPTVRYGAPFNSSSVINTLLNYNNGFEFNSTGTVALYPYRVIGTTSVQTLVFNTATFPTTWTSTELALLSQSTTQHHNPGFLLHTVK